MKFDDQHILTSEGDVQKQTDKLESYIQYVHDEVGQNGYDAAESFVNLPVDKEVLSLVGDAVRDKKTPGLKYIIVIGMGGSSLGTKALYTALHGYTDQFESQRFPKCIFLDTIDETLISTLSTFLSEAVTHPEEVVVNIVSESGETTETLANTDLIIAMLEKRWGTILDRIVVTTNFSSPLWKKAQELEIARLAIPEQVLGRFSVFSPVGLFPLALCDVNVSALLSGAKEMREACLVSNGESNPALRSAVHLYLQYKQGKRIHNTFLFSAALEPLGKWYRQLMGESIGKENIAFTPIVSIGPADLHSVGQLYVGGGQDKVTTFISIKEKEAVGERVSGNWAEQVKGKTADDIAHAILRGVQQTYTEKEIPFMDIILEEKNLHELGAFMQMKMCEMMYLAKLLGVNAFDQPAVEAYKENTRKLLEK